MAVEIAIEYFIETSLTFSTLLSFQDFGDSATASFEFAYYGFRQILLYGGMITSTIGGIMELTAPKQTRRHNKGKYILIAGTAMLLLYFGTDIMLGLLYEIFEPTFDGWTPTS